MFRRIELISGMSAAAYQQMIDAIEQAGQPVDRTLTRYWKSGLMGYGNETVMGTWSSLNNPRRALFKNARFFFTEAGWRRYGRPTIDACQRTGQHYRVIAIKEHSIDIVYRDEFQVAIRPRKRRDPTRGHS
jgi:hypothetical protein